MKIIKSDMPETDQTGAANIGMHLIRESRWNVHNKTDDDIHGLAKSIKEAGIIQRLAVRPIDGGAKYELVDGHRRFRAAKILGLNTVPCVVMELDDAAAQSATLAANMQRLENNPLLEAALIGRMRKAGKGVKEIAAALGKSETFISRRAKLTDLSKDWTKAFAEIGDAVPVWLMEKIAAFEGGIQHEAFQAWAGTRTDFTDYDFRDGDCDEITEALDGALREIDEDKIPFDVSQCRKCPWNTATQADLFPDYAEKCGRCQNPECFDRKWNGAIDAEIDRCRAQGCKVAAVQNKWNIPQSYNATPRKELGNTQPYVWQDGTLKHLAWSVPKEGGKTRTAKTEAEKVEERAEKKRVETIRTARGKIIEAAKRFIASDDFSGGAIYTALAIRRLERDMQSPPWWNLTFVDDFARTCLEELDAGLTDEEQAVYLAELERMEAVEAERWA